MALQIAETADHQWEMDLVELLGLEVATNAFTRPRALRGRLVRIYLPMLGGVALAALLPALILLERWLAPETMSGGPSAVRLVAAASNPVTLPTRSSRLPRNFPIKMITLTDEPSPGRLSPNDEQSQSAFSAGSRPGTGPQPLVKLSAEPEGLTEASKPDANAPEHLHRAIANVPAVIIRSTVASPSTAVARSELRADHPLATTAPLATVDLGDTSSSGTSRHVAYPIGESQPGFQIAGGRVQSPPLASGDKAKAKDKKRRTDAIDALRLLRRQ